MAATASAQPAHPSAFTLAPLIISDHHGIDLQDGKLVGTGEAHFTSGNTYRGPFINGYMEGTDAGYQWADGVRYQGEFQRNKLVGKGTYHWTNGSRYEGQLLNGLRHGKGIMVCGPVSHAQYEGDWQQGKVHGKGRLTYNQDGTSSYEGSWLNGMRHGQGVMRYGSGNVYEGEWQHNVKRGKGRMRWGERGEEYNGEWQNGRPNGYGVYTWTLKFSRPHQFPLQNRYEGQWLNGKRNGRGTFQYAHGGSYTGEWKDNMKHGWGQFISENGRRYVGEFVNDRATGQVPKFENDCPQALNIRDILYSAEYGTADEQLKQINGIIMRYIGDLREVYNTYTQLGRSPEELKECAALTRVQIVKLLKDCYLLLKGVTLADIDRAYTVQFRDDPCFETRFNRPHYPYETFTFHDFFSFLLRTAHLLYRNKKDLSLHDRGLAAEFAYLIKNDVIPNIPHPNSETTEDLNLPNDDMDAEWLVEFERDFGNRTYKLYADKAHHKSRTAIPNCTGDMTITMRETLLMMKDYGLVKDDDKGPLTIKRTISILGRGMPDVDDGNGTYNLEFELVPYELFEILYACAVVTHEDLFKRTVAPFLKKSSSQRPAHEVAVRIMDDDGVVAEIPINISQEDVAVKPRESKLANIHESEEIANVSQANHQDSHDSESIPTQDERAVGGKGVPLGDRTRERESISKPHGAPHAPREKSRSLDSQSSSALAKDKDKLTVQKEEQIASHTISQSKARAHGRASNASMLGKNGKGDREKDKDSDSSHAKKSKEKEVHGHSQDGSSPLPSLQVHDSNSQLLEGKEDSMLSEHCISIQVADSQALSEDSNHSGEESASLAGDPSSASSLGGGSGVSVASAAANPEKHLQVALENFKEHMKATFEQVLGAHEEWKRREAIRQYIIADSEEATLM
ncbi:hypothetical protein DFS34DRAFT_652014 [Phlyctochytrium arcticum]|nr:hypothetical protein DFS34DRAFT_652014 [Phlyctochytrium arcticum]